MSVSRDLGNQALFVIFIGILMCGLFLMENILVQIHNTNTQNSRAYLSNMGRSFSYSGPTVAIIGLVVYVGCLIGWCVEGVKTTKSKIQARHSVCADIGLPGYVHARRVS